ncbi:MAG TPA: HlyD family type I secretion periplasmic adaptor subunit [Burkholderiaceae bacterium]|jgi:hemolysin D
MSTVADTVKQVPPGHPLPDLLRHYAAIFKAAWAMRDQLAGPKRLADERAFMPAAMALQETPPHPAPRRAAIAICLIFVVGLLWAFFGKVDIVAVAQGHIVVSQRSKQIQPLETSVVQAIYVKDGDKVKAGQLLIQLDATSTQADAKRVDEDRIAATSELLRTQSLLSSLANGTAPQLQTNALPSADANEARIQLQGEWTDISAQVAKLEAEIVHRRAEIATTEQMVMKLQTTLPLAQARESDYQTLAKQGFIAGHATQDRTRERIEMERDLATAIARRAEAQAGLSEGQQTLNAYRAETARSLRERMAQAELKTKQLGEDGIKAGKRDALTRLTAPVTGTVQQLAVHTPGGVVTPAQVLLVLVPDDSEVTAEVTLENKDMGFVREGQIAEVKLETFPYTRYGTVPAVVKTISADAVNDEKRGAVFPVTLTLEKSSLAVDGRPIKLAPGMNLAAEIRIGQRRAIDYLAGPVREHLDDSLRER